MRVAVQPSGFDFHGNLEVIGRIDQDSTYVKCIARVAHEPLASAGLLQIALSFQKVLIAKPVIGAKAYCH